jgi:hypothetical protein
MFTGKLPIDLDRYQIRFMGTRPLLARTDRALDGFIGSGVLQPTDLGQAVRNGLPSWYVNLVIRDRESGAAAPVRVRVESSTEPHAELTRGEFVTFDRLEIGWPAVGRHEPQFSYLGLRTTQGGASKVTSAGLGQFAVLPDGLTIEVQQVSPKLDQNSVTQAVRDTARVQGVDLTEHLPQARNANDLPKWVLDVIILTDDGMFLEKLNVASATEPQVLGDVTVEGLTIMGGVTPYPSSIPWVSLSAARVFAARGQARNGRKGRDADTTEGTPAEGSEVTV